MPQQPSSNHALARSSVSSFHCVCLVCLASDSLAPLLAYHGLAITPSAALTTTTITTPAGDSTVNEANSIVGLGGVTTASLAPSSSLLTASSSLIDRGRNGLNSFAPQPISALTAVQEANEEARSRAGSTQVTNGSSGEETPASAVNLNGADSTTTPVVQSVPALIIQQSSRRLTSYLHGLIPVYSSSGQLLRYNPVTSSSTKLPIHEDYKLDGEYHTLTTSRGRVQARAYIAPHGQSILVDTRCQSKYDLERTERFLENDGKTLVLEIRILSCAPEYQSSVGESARGVSAKFSQQKTAILSENQIKVKEILFLRRVFTKIIDADPNAKTKSLTTPTSESKENDPTRVHLPAFGSGNATSLSGKINFDSAENHHSPVKMRQPILAANQIHLPPKAATILPTKLVQSLKSNESLSTSPVTSTSTSFNDQLLYPRPCLLSNYDLTHLCSTETNASSSSDSSLLQELVSSESSHVASAKNMMRLVDLCFILFLIYLAVGPPITRIFPCLTQLSFGTVFSYTFWTSLFYPWYWPDLLFQALTPIPMVESVVDVESIVRTVVDDSWLFFFTRWFIQLFICVLGFAAYSIWSELIQRMVIRVLTQFGRMIARPVTLLVVDLLGHYFPRLKEIVVEFNLLSSDTTAAGSVRPHSHPTSSTSSSTSSTVRHLHDGVRVIQGLNRLDELSQKYSGVTSLLSGIQVTSNDSTITDDDGMS